MSANETERSHAARAAGVRSSADLRRAWWRPVRNSGLDPSIRFRAARYDEADPRAEIAMSAPAGRHLLRLQFCLVAAAIRSS